MNKPRKIGTRFETEVKDFLKPIWPQVERTGSRAYERGDLDGTPEFTVEVKAHRELSVAAFVTQALAAQQRTGTRFAAVVAKRRGKGVGQAYWIMTLEQARDLLGQSSCGPDCSGDRLTDAE